MRVAIVHFTAPPVMGGVESVIREHARLLMEHGHAVTVVAGRGGPMRGGHVDFQRLPLLATTNPTQRSIARELDRGITSPAFDKLTEAIYADLSPILGAQDAVITHNAVTLHFNTPLTTVLCRLAATTLFDRVVAWTHDVAAVNPLYADELHPGYPWNLFRCPQPGIRYVCISKQRRDQLLALWTSNGVSHPNSPDVIANGMEIANVLRLSCETVRLMQRYRLLDRDPVMLLPVRITRRKNIELAIDVTAELRRRGRDPILLVTGPTAPHHPGRSRTYLGELKQRTLDQKAAGDVAFIAESIGRPLKDREVADLYSLSDVLLIPSRSEGFGLPILEAGVTRLPIVASRLPVFEELARDAAAYFDLDSRPEDVAEVVLQAVSAPPARVHRTFMREYGWDSIYFNKIEPLLQSLNHRRTA